MILAWLLLLTGLTISAVAIYYSVVGLTAIFSAAAIPIIIMGSALEIGKLVCASWLKANWERTPRFMKYYMTIAVIVLMLITSMGIFGFLSKAHNDQTLVSGDVGSKIAIYDEKIKTAKDNIDANRKALKQMDDAVDQVMGRSNDEKGADKAVQIRRSQQKERARLQSEISTEQKTISQLSEERAPIAAEVRKVEAEVGPIKYIAAFIYGTSPDESMLERAVTWIIILIVIVFDPLAVIMLLAAQMTFGWNKKEESTPLYEPDDGPLTNDQIDQIHEQAVAPIITTPEEEKDKLTDTHEEPIEYQFLDEFHEPDHNVTPVTALGGDITAPEQDRIMIEEEARKYHPEQQLTPEIIRQIETGELTFEANSEIVANIDEVTVSETEESKKKTYMIKDPLGKTQIKNREV
jgi:hypothetical protein